MRTDNAILAGLACLKVAIHLAASAFGAYGYVRDELYYLACSDRMAWGYVDHPPFSVAALTSAPDLISSLAMSVWPL